MLEHKHIVRLFTRMAHLYGHRWSSVYGDATDERGNVMPSARQWLLDIGHLAPQQVALGVQRTMERGLAWPPGPIEFIALCEDLPDLEDVLAGGDDPRVQALRARMDFYLLDGLPSRERREVGERQYRRAVHALRRSGALAALTAPAAHAALGAANDA